MPTKLVPVLFGGLLGTGAIFGANNLMNSGAVDGKPGGIGIGNRNDSTGLYKNGCAVNSGT